MDKFEYVHSNTWKKEHDSENNKEKDGFEVLSNGFYFSRNKKNKSSNRWVCKYKGCGASLTINYDGDIDKKSEQGHNHNPLGAYELKKDKLEKKLKERCSLEDKGVYKIFEEEVNELFKTLKTSDEKQKMASLMPDIESIKHGLQKRKTKIRPKLPDSIKSTIFNQLLR